MAGLGPLKTSLRHEPPDAATSLSNAADGGVQYFDVKKYGAKGDGIADDRDTIQAALDAAELVKGTVYFPPGTYMISDGLTIATGVKMLGASKRVVTIKLMDSFPLDSNVLNGGSSTDVVVSEIGWHGNDLVMTSRAIRFALAGTERRVRIERCKFEDFIGIETIYADSAWDMHVTDCEFEDCIWPIHFREPNGRSTILRNRITSSRNLSTFGIVAAAFSAIDAPMLIEGNHIYDIGVDTIGAGSRGDGIQVFNTRGIRVIGNHVEHTLWAGIRVGSNAFGATVQGNTARNCRPGIYVELSINSSLTVGTGGVRRGASVVGNTVDGDGQSTSSGIHVSWSAGCVVNGNVVMNTWSEGIFTDSDHTVIVGNKVQNAWMGGTPGGGLTIKAGIRCDQAAYCTIVGNDCYDNQTVKTQEYGIAVMDEENTVVGNKVRENATGGIYQNGNAVTNFVAWNDDGRGTTPYSLTAGGDIFPPQGEEFVVVDGNTQINLITGSRPGTRLTLKFTGTPTVKHGTFNIRLAGAVDFVASADDTLSLVFDGTNWYETSRTVI